MNKHFFETHEHFKMSQTFFSVLSIFSKSCVNISFECTINFLIKLNIILSILQINKSTKWKTNEINELTLMGHPTSHAPKESGDARSRTRRDKDSPKPFCTTKSLLSLREWEEIFIFFQANPHYFIGIREYFWNLGFHLEFL